MLNDKVVLITGGTGSFGQKLTETLLDRYRLKRLIIFSRDEQKHFRMGQKFPDSKYQCIRYFIGDIRDKSRLELAFRDVDYIVHAAAMKHVPLSEYNPIECVRTNILGAQNLIEVATAVGVKKVIALSTDKACNPINLYGATKLASDKLFISANNYARAVYSVVRYGNVIGSNGSVIPFFLKIRDRGRFPITDPRMTRFWISLQQSVDFVIARLLEMQGGELFVPKIRSMRITDLAEAIDPDAEIDVVGIRPGEKLHETLISEDDARATHETDQYFVVSSDSSRTAGRVGSPGRNVPEDFRYSSDLNSEWISVEEMRTIINEELLPELQRSGGLG